MAAASIVGTVLVLRLWHADPRVLLGYSTVTDGLHRLAFTKGLMTNPGFWYNGFIGFPGGTNYFDFPKPDLATFLAIKFLGLFTTEPGLVNNLIFLVGFPLTAVSALAVFRQCRIGWSAAAVGALLFTLSPYHFFRGTSHLYLSLYFHVPWLVLVALWIFQGEAFLRPRQSGTWRRPTARGWIAVAVCLVSGSLELYYAFFGCCFFAIAGLAAGCRARTIKPILVGTVFAFLLGGTVVGNLSPSLVHVVREGRNRQVAIREPRDSEVLGLKVAQLLLPIDGHRIPRLARLREYYDGWWPSNETAMASLGGVASCGFLFLVGWLVFGIPRNEDDRALQMVSRLAVLNGAAVLGATVGGFSTVFALVVTPQIRAFNRVSIFIAFFSLLALGLLFEQWWRRAGRRARVLAGVVLVVVLIGGCLDQTSDRFIPDYAADAASFASDKDFVRTVEARMPPGAAIFQLPYVSYPEAPARRRMADYSLFRGFLHSQTLKWSYGAMRGRRTDLWQHWVTAKDVGEMVDVLCHAGFSGVYVDRYGYSPEECRSLETALESTLGEPPVVSADGRLAFYSMLPLAVRLHHSESRQTWLEKTREAMVPILFQWTRFTPLAGDSAETKRVRGKGEIELLNEAGVEKTVKISMNVTAAESPTNLAIQLNGNPLHDVPMALGPTTVSVTVTVPPGVSNLCLSPVEGSLGGGQAREFFVQDFRVEE